MLYMIELHYSAEHRDEALRYFLKHGATHYEGKVTVKELWAATQDRVAYALVSAEDASEIDKACGPLRQFGEIFYRQVTSANEL